MKEGCRNWVNARDEMDIFCGDEANGKIITCTACKEKKNGTKR